MSLIESGINKYAELITKNNEQAEYLGNEVIKHKKLKLLTPVTMSIVCFQYVKDSLTQEETNNINQEIIIQLQEQGIASPSSTILHGNYCIRVCIVNHKTKKNDLDELIHWVLKIGNEISEKLEF